MNFKKLSIIAITIFSSSTLFSQVNLETNATVGNIPAGSAFIDASSFYDKDINGNNIGKGLVFPRVNLVNFEFNTDLPDGAAVLPTYYDGMIVYNTGEGTTLTTGGKRSSTATLVTPGFYYFSNQGSPTSVTSGKWVRIGDGSANAKLALVQETGTTQSPAVATNLSIDNKDVFAVKGTFTNDGGNTVNIKKPEGFKTLHSIKMYRISGNTGAKQLAGSSLYSYEDVTEGSETKLKLVFGSGIISISYPEGEYEYVLEYLK